ncbi:MAG: hypothetical protein QXJ28_00490 [Candidatus Pacearchaeota archaeon]
MSNVINNNLIGSSTLSKKKGLSEIVAYVMLVLFVISMAVLVYVWLKIQLPKEKIECSDEVSVSISNYSCDPINKFIIITLQNKGLFYIDGVNIRVSNRSGDPPTQYISPTITPFAIPPEFSFLNDEYRVWLGSERDGFLYFSPGSPVQRMRPGFKYTLNLNYSQNNRLYSIQITPFILKEGTSSLDVIICSKSKIIQNLDNCN